MSNIHLDFVISKIMNIYQTGISIISDNIYILKSRILETHRQLMDISNVHLVLVNHLGRSKPAQDKCG